MTDLEVVRRKIAGRAIPPDIRADLAALVAAVERLETRCEVLATERDTAREHATLWQRTAEGRGRELDRFHRMLAEVNRVGAQ